MDDYGSYRDGQEKQNFSPGLGQANEHGIEEATPANGENVLDDVSNYLARFVAYPSEHARYAHTLWLAHTHLMDKWDATPRIAFLSPEPGSGKSRCLEVSAHFVPNPVEAVNVTPAYLFRKVGDVAARPTILFDEIDTIFGPKARENEEIRGLLNAGHRRHSVAGRCVVRGKEVLTEEIPAYSAVGLAGLGNLPETILSRSVIVRMRKRRPDEVVEPYRRRVNGPEGDEIGARLANWCAGSAELVVYSELPPEIVDRDADVWEPLICVADLAGGHWPDTARAASLALVGMSQQQAPSLGIQLLSDLREIFLGSSKLHSKTIISQLCQLEEAPWSGYRGTGIDALSLARTLSEYGVKPKDLRIGDKVSRGYVREDLEDPWRRYLPE
ncbi:MAG: DUF3631 domain-containing protein [Pseudomonadota bacterium]